MAAVEFWQDSKPYSAQGSYWSPPGGGSAAAPRHITLQALGIAAFAGHLLMPPSVRWFSFGLDSCRKHPLSRGVHPIGGNRSSPLIGRFKGVGCWEGGKSKSPLPNWPLPTFGQTKVGPRRAYPLGKPPVPVQIAVLAGGPVRPGSAAAHWPKPSVSPLSPHQSARKWSGCLVVISYLRPLLPIISFLITLVNSI